MPLDESRQEVYKIRSFAESSPKQAKMSQVQDPVSVELETTTTIIITLPNGVAIRRFAMTDIECAVKSLNNPAVRLFLRNIIPTPYTEDNARWWINHCNDTTTWLRSGPWTAEELKASPAADLISSHSPPMLPTHYAITKDGKQIGAIGVTPKSDIYFRTVELGYWLAEPYWGKGIMGSVAKAYVEWVFATFGVVHRIEAEVFEANAPSASVLRRAGLSYEGRKKGAVCKNGQVADEDIYGVVRMKEFGS